MNVELLRLEQTDEGARGVLRVRERIIAVTLEPDANDPERAQIPPGKYRCKRVVSRSFGETFEVKVKGHTHVYFHWGNVEEDTVMCILLGMGYGWLNNKKAVLNSRTAHKFFMNLMTGIDEFNLYVTFVPEQFIA